MSDKVRVPSIQCPRCDFNNPEGTASCFECGGELDPTPNRLVTVRRRRHSATAISLQDLAAVRARMHRIGRGPAPSAASELRRCVTGNTDRPQTRRVIVTTRSVLLPEE